MRGWAQLCLREPRGLRPCQSQATEGEAGAAAGLPVGASWPESVVGRSWSRTECVGPSRGTGRAFDPRGHAGGQGGAPDSAPAEEPSVRSRPTMRSRPDCLGASPGRGSGRTLSRPHPSPGVAAALGLRGTSLVFGTPRSVAVMCVSSTWPPLWVAQRRLAKPRGNRWSGACRGPAVCTRQSHVDGAWRHTAPGAQSLGPSNWGHGRPPVAWSPH